MKHAATDTTRTPPGKASVRDVLVTFVLVVFMAGPALLAAGQAAGIDVPSWLGSDDARWLSGAVKETDIPGELSLEGFTSKRLQEQLSDEVGNHIPAKASALLGTAGLQRGAIAASNALFGWPCYPTRFGSSVLCLPGSDALTPLPERSDPSYWEGLETFADGVASAAARHPDTRFVVFSVPGHRAPAVSPAYGLASDPVTADASFSAIEDALADAPGNVVALTLGYESDDAYYEDFYRTDHHWKASGALAGYNAVADALGFERIDDAARVPVEGYRFVGSRARSGLYLLSEDVFALDCDLSGIVVAQEGSDPTPYNHDAFFTADPAGVQYRFHDLYFDFMKNRTLLSNTAEGATGRALVVTDSFGADIDPLLATCYRDTFVIFDLASNGLWEKAASIEDALAEGAYDDVYFIASPFDFFALCRDAPGYFG